MEGVTRRGVITVVVVAGAVGLLALVATGARVPLATQGTGGWHLSVHNPPPDRELLLPRMPTGELPNKHVPGAGAITALIQAVLIISVVTIFAAGLRAVWKVVRMKKEPPPPKPPPDALRVPAPDALVDVLDESLEALTAGPVDEVVIACWVKLEDAAASAGVERRPSETASELAARVLTDFDAPPEAISRLLARYRTARYSRHPLGEDDRAVAIRALEDIRGAIVGTPA